MGDIYIQATARSTYLPMHYNKWHLSKEEFQFTISLCGRLLYKTNADGYRSTLYIHRIDRICKDCIRLKALKDESEKANAEHRKLSKEH